MAVTSGGGGLALWRWRLGRTEWFQHSSKGLDMQGFISGGQEIQQAIGVCDYAEGTEADR